MSWREWIADQTPTEPEATEVAAVTTTAETELSREEKMRAHFNNASRATFAQRKAAAPPAPAPVLIAMGRDTVVVNVGGIRDQRLEELEVELFVEKGHSARRWVKYPGQAPMPLFDNVSRTESVTRLRPGQLRRPANRFRDASPANDTSRPV